MPREQPIDPRLTEQRNPLTAEIDRLSPLEIVDLINSEDAEGRPGRGTRSGSDRAGPRAGRGALRAGGRLIYVGAGTSGRLGVLDASEMPPTFGTDPEMVQG
jgi:N-acetylmuramic acid 6-phosphate etherase